MRTTIQRIATMRTVASATVLAVAAMAVPAFAQDAQSGENEASEIVVTGQFVNQGASSATKLDIPVLDTPLTVSSYNENFLKAIETTGISDLYRYMAGVQRAGNTGYDVTIRGFKNGGGDRNSIVTDGLPGLSVRFGSPPTVGVQSVEVVKGPTSVLYGQAQPGGFINIISKKPEGRASYEVSLRAASGLGEFDRAKNFTASIDATGPIDRDGKFLYRVVAEIADIKGFRDSSFEKPFYIAPMLTWNIGDSTKLTLQGEYRKTRTNYSNQLVVTSRDINTIAPFTTQYQSPTDYQTENGKVGTVMFEHEFSKALKVNLNYRYVDHFDSAYGFDNNGVTYNAIPAGSPAGTVATPTGLLNRRARGQANIRTYDFLDASITAKFATFGIEHQLILGGNMGTEVSDFNRSQFYNSPNAGTPARVASGLFSASAAAPTLNIAVANPVHNELALSAYPLCNLTGQASAFGWNLAECSLAGSSLQWRVTTQKSKAVFISDVIDISDMFKVLVGLRYANEKQSLIEKRVAGFTAPDKDDSSWLPMAGLVFKPKENISLYTSYSTSFVQVAPNTQDYFGQNPFPPTKAKSIEFGFKAELFDKRVNITSAYFDIKKTDTLNNINCPTAAQLTAQGIAIPAGATVATGTCAVPVGEERSKGFELEVNATPTDNWTLSMSYTHTEARIAKSNVADAAGNLVQVGSRLTNAPDDTFNLWSRYDFKEGALKGFGFGVGVAYVGARVGYLPVAALPTGVANREVELLTMPSFTLVDLGLYYKATSNLDLTFKISNLFDKRYIESTGFSGDFQMLPGQPRLATLSARLKF